MAARMKSLVWYGGFRYCAEEAALLLRNAFEMAKLVLHFRCVWAHCWAQHWTGKDAILTDGSIIGDSCVQRIPRHCFVAPSADPGPLHEFSFAAAVRGHCWGVGLQDRNRTDLQKARPIVRATFAAAAAALIASAEP
eukprot:CAMPEP_0172890982 /NCGR_PEP_ID=MMETSP1075-20121228/142630_1 /TAXON_ID=2916 /ORGANISM="Ceratium fusus, Strain PA161109" /LENGTH=136 /DNA_ID=CAMNT_0013745345 /DNA_START=222 /DNA_END=628 /DNA_ORIENTATION=-